MANIVQVVDEIDQISFTTSLKLDSLDECGLHLKDTKKQYSIVSQNIRSINKILITSTLC